jgi:hypothetical protein
MQWTIWKTVKHNEKQKKTIGGHWSCFPTLVDFFPGANGCHSKVWSGLLLWAPVGTFVFH